MPADRGTPIPATPFIAWLDAELERLRRDTGLAEHTGQGGVFQTGATKALAQRLGISERGLLRYRSGLNSLNQPTDTFPRNLVEDMLDRVGVGMWEVYPDLEAQEPLLEDAYCRSCHETVTPIDGDNGPICPWCDRTVTYDIPQRGYCATEEAMRFPAVDGNCWRCGGVLSPHVPWADCACGCGTLIHRFRPTDGRAVHYAIGHGSPPLRRLVPAGPFREWLTDELHNLDPIQSLARRVGVARDDLLALLNGHQDMVELWRVGRCLWLAGREGQGRGLPERPGSTQLADLYPDAVRSKVCPECGGGKAPHATLCRNCRRKAGPMHPSARGQPSSVTDEIVLEAKRLHDQGMAIAQAARRLHGRTRCHNSESLANVLRERFQARGWPTHASPKDRAA